MTDETWSSGEIVRSIRRIEETLTEMRAEQRAAGDRHVTREAWDSALAGLKEWKSQVSAEVINSNANVARLQQSVSDDVAGLRREVDERFDKVRLERVAFTKWSLSLGIPTIVSVLALILTR